MPLQYMGRGLTPIFTDDTDWKADHGFFGVRGLRHIFVWVYLWAYEEDDWVVSGDVVCCWVGC